MTTERLAEISERLTTPRLGRSMARETDLDLLAIRDLLAEVRRLQAAVERVRELHRPGNYSASRGVWTWWDVCPTCGDKSGVHPCGCWRDEDQIHICAECNKVWPCATAEAIETALAGAAANLDLPVDQVTSSEPSRHSVHYGR